MPEPLVSVCCLAYNHEHYICECLEGFLKQKTNFPFEVLIHDDASTDKTASIIREYEAKHPEIIKPIYQVENQFSKGVGVTLTIQFPRAKGKYIAMCEGDDYWTDPLKLQKQVDFLEANPEYGLVHTEYDRYFQKSKRKTLRFNNNSGKYIPLGNVYENIIQTNFICTPTVLLRRRVLTNYLSDINPLDKNWTVNDYPMWIYLSYHSKIYYLSDNTAVYRLAEGSLDHTDDPEKKIKYLQGQMGIAMYFAEKYIVSKRVMQNVRVNFYRFSLVLAYYKKDRVLAKKSFVYLKEKGVVKPKDFIFFLMSNNHIAEILFSGLRKIKNQFRGW